MTPLACFEEVVASGATLLVRGDRVLVESYGLDDELRAHLAHHGPEIRIAVIAAHRAIERAGHSTASVDRQAHE